MTFPYDSENVFWVATVAHLPHLVDVKPPPI